MSALNVELRCPIDGQIFGKLTRHRGGAWTIYRIKRYRDRLKGTIKRQAVGWDDLEDSGSYPFRCRRGHSAELSGRWLIERGSDTLERYGIRSDTSIIVPRALLNSRRIGQAPPVEVR